MIKIEQGVWLKNFSTFRIGGEVGGFCRIKNEQELLAFLNLAKEKNKEIYFLGGGSNILFSDEFWPGWVAKIENKQKLELVGEKIICGAGVSLARLVSFALENSLSGLEWAVGIPGTVGGAVRGNAGAFDGQIADCIETVEVFDWKNEIGKKSFFSWKDCHFFYRESVFKKEKKWLIWEIKLKLNFGDQEKIQNKMKEILAKRKNNQPSLSQFPSVGSIFKNPQASQKIIELFEKEKGVVAKNGKVPAGWLIEKSGLKGKTIGKAQVSPKQANFIVNLGDASAGEVERLIKLIKKTVKEKFALELEEEIEIFKNCFFGKNKI